MATSIIPENFRLSSCLIESPLAIGILFLATSRVQDCPDMRLTAKVAIIATINCPVTEIYVIPAADSGSDANAMSVHYGSGHVVCV